jgi:hypothetical protein
MAGLHARGGDVGERGLAVAEVLEDLFHRGTF